MNGMGNPTFQEFLILFIEAGFTGIQFGIQLLGQLIPVALQFLLQLIFSQSQT